MIPPEYILEMRSIRKTFGPVVALDSVDLNLKRGEIHGLLGGNGAGKTTLMNVLYGLYRSDGGQLLLDGQPLEIDSPQDAIASGIGMVHQQFLQINSFTVTENIVLGTELKNRPTLQLDAEKARIEALGQHFGLPVDPDALVQDLPMGVRQRVEILKALYRGVKILVLDEPTTNLTPQEVDALFDSLQAMVGEGLSVIFITHKLREVLAVCDRISVLRHGRNVLTLERSEASEEAFIRGMVGEDLDVEESILFRGGASSGQPEAGQAPMLQLAGLTVGTEAVPLIRNCSLAVHSGEILGIAGVAGNGQLELAEAILGIREPSRGQISVESRDCALLGTRQMLDLGLAYIPEDRWLDGFLPQANVAQNLILGLHRRKPYSDGRFLDWPEIKARSRSLIEEFNIHTQGPDDTAGNLSGGNIQRVMLARAFSQPVRLLIAHNPTRGLDLPSTEFVYRRLLERKAEGMATLLISENLDELFLLSDRIAVLSRGEVMGVLPRSEFDAYVLGRMMTGVRRDD